MKHRSRDVAGIKVISARIPDETTPLLFRNVLDNHNFGKDIHRFSEDCVFQTVKVHLKAPGVAMQQGRIIEDTSLAAPNSTTSKQGERVQSCIGRGLPSSGTTAVFKLCSLAQETLRRPSG